VWTPYLLPCIAFSEGASPLPPAKAFWRNAALIVADSLSDQATATAAELDSPGWFAACSEIKKSYPSVEIPIPFQDSLQSPDSGDRRYLAALKWLDPNVDAGRLTFLHRRLPALLSAGRAVPPLEKRPRVNEQEIVAVRSALSL
jgi:hypothetical protein